MLLSRGYELWYGENKPIRKQVPADSPMRCIRWGPVLEVGQSRVGLFRSGEELGVAKKHPIRKLGARHVAN